MRKNPKNNTSQIQNFFTNTFFKNSTASPKEEIEQLEIVAPSHKKGASLDLSFLNTDISRTPSPPHISSLPSSPTKKMNRKSKLLGENESNDDSSSFFNQPPEPGMQDMMKMFQMMQAFSTGGMNFGKNQGNQRGFDQPAEDFQVDETFESMEEGQDSGARAPKDMLKIFHFFSNCFEDSSEDGMDIKGFTEKWNLGAYNKYVLGAKRMKELMRTSGAYKKEIKFSDGSPAFTVVVGTDKQGVRSSVETSTKILTYPDFLACISLKAIHEEWCEEYPSAPLAANITHENAEFKKSGHHIVGHGGLPAIINYFYNSELTWVKSRTKDKDDAWGPSVPDLVIMASFMDDQATGALKGMDNTLTSISRTCGVSADVLLKDAVWDGWSVAEQVTQARRTAAGLRSTINKNLKKGKSGPTPASSSTIKRRGLGSK